MLGLIFKSGSTYLWVAVIAIVLGGYSYIKILKAQNESNQMRIEVLSDNIEANKLYFNQQLEVTKFNVKVATEKKAIEKTIKKEKNVKSNKLNTNPRFYL